MAPARKPASRRSPPKPSAKAKPPAVESTDVMNDARCSSDQSSSIVRVS